MIRLRKVNLGKVSLISRLKGKTSDLDFHRLCVRAILSVFFIVAVAGCGTESNRRGDDQASGAIDRATIYRDQGQYRSAMIELKKAAKAGVNTNALREAQAALSVDLGQFRPAVKLLEQISPGERSAEAEALLLKALLGLRKFASAEQLMAGSLHLSEMQKNLAKAQIALNFNEIEKSKSLFESVVQQEAWSSKGHIGLATIDAIEGNFEPAVKRLEDLIEHDPKDILARITYSRILYRSGQVEPAEDALSNALIELPQTDIMQPEKRVVLNMLVDILTEQGRTSEAMVYLKSLSDENPASSELQSKFRDAMIAWEDGDLPKAKQLFGEIYEQSPADKVGTMLAMVEYLQGDHQRAAELFERHTDPETASSGVLNVMSRSLVRDGRLDAAMAATEKARLNSPDNPNIQGLEGLLMLSADQAQGEAAVKDALEKNPKQKSLWMALSRYYIVQEKYDQAEDALRSALKHYPNNFDIQRNWVGLKLSAGDVDAARSLINGWLKADKKSPGVKLLEGDLAVIEDRFDDAQKSYESVLKATFTNEREKKERQAAAHRGLVNVFLSQKAYQKAESQANQLIQVTPERQLGYKFLISIQEAQGVKDSAAVDKQLRSLSESFDAAAPLLVLTEYYYRNQQLDQAKKVLAEVQEQYPDTANLDEAVVAIAYRAARSAMETQNLVEAREEVLKGLKVMPENSVLNQTLVRIELSNQNFREAKKLIERMNLPESKSYVREHLRGELAAAEGDLAKAERLLTSAWQAGGGDASAHRVYQLLKEQKKPVIPFLAEWHASNDPPSGAAEVVLANEYLAQGNYARAAERYESLVSRSPKNALLLNNLAWCYYKMNDKRALPTAEKAVELAGNSAPILDTLGVILDANGQTKRAVKVLELAASLDPHAQDIKSHLEAARAKL